MHIVIKSEMDSRPVIYPLMRCLMNYGSILVITNNRVFNRLIESQVSGGFRNITILVDSADSADEVCNDYGVAIGDYDFVIIDNLGSSESDVYIMMASTYVTPEFDDEIEMMVNNESLRTVLFQFGGTNRKERIRKEIVAVEEEEPEDIIEDETPKQRRARLKREKEEQAVAKREERKRQQEKERQQRKQKGKENPLEGYDPAEKFRAMTAGKSARSKKSVQVPFPSLQDMEKLEAEHVFPLVDEKMYTAFYELLGADLAVERIEFQKEVRRKDEGGGNIRTRQSMR